jgi:hypothetical protein
MMQCNQINNAAANSSSQLCKSIEDNESWIPMIALHYNHFFQVLLPETVDSKLFWSLLGYYPSSAVLEIEGFLGFLEEETNVVNTIKAAALSNNHLGRTGYYKANRLYSCLCTCTN